MAGPTGGPPHLRGKSIPPHLRAKQKQAATNLSSAQNEATSTTQGVPSSRNTKTQSASASANNNATPSKAAGSPSSSKAAGSPSSSKAAGSPSSSKANGLAASKHAPPAFQARVQSSARAQDTTEKLTSLGVKVSQPRAVSRRSLVAYATSDEGGCSSLASPKKADSALGKSNASAVAAEWCSGSVPANPDTPKATAAILEQTKPIPTGPAKMHDPVQRSTAPHQRGGGLSGRPGREARWPKNSEIPKGDPERWAIKWGSDKDDARSVDSARADSGWVKGKKKAVPPGHDPETGFLLTDFSGNWAPAPVDWDSRPAFRPQQSVEIIEKWKRRIEEEMVGKSWKISQEDLTGADGVTFYFAPDPLRNELLIQGDMAPRYWAPVVVGRDSPSTFWNKIVLSKQPEPQNEDDLAGAKPWWETYAVADGSSLKPYEHPEIKGIQPGETQNERLRRENDFGSMHHAENRKRVEQAKRVASREKRLRVTEKAQRLLAAGKSTEPSREIKPGMNLYLRSACHDDMARIKDIYNHYVEHSVSVPETERRRETDMIQRFNDIAMKKLPFLIACERGVQLKGRKKKNVDPITLPDKIVGFAYADDHHDLKGMYRFTCDVEIYTDSTLYMKGIGKCLLDKLLGLLDMDYLERGGYDTEGVELDGTGVSRVISNIIATVPFEKQERLEWKRRFLTEFGGFKQVGLVEGTGVKMGHSVSVAIFQRKTGMTIDPTNPPIMSDYATSPLP